MTPTTKAWIEKRLNMLSPDAYTLEIGSMDINGRIKRTERYIGIDMREGPNVDKVCNSHQLPFDSKSFDTVVCAETLEHDDAPWLTAAEIHRVLKSKGIVIITVPGIGFGKHNFPVDYWRFTAAGVKVLFKEFEVLEMAEDSAEHAVRGMLKK